MGLEIGVANTYPSHIGVTVTMRSQNPYSTLIGSLFLMTLAILSPSVSARWTGESIDPRSGTIFVTCETLDPHGCPGGAPNWSVFQPVCALGPVGLGPYQVSWICTSQGFGVHFPANAICLRNDPPFVQDTQECGVTGP